ncbi:uncharacterized protein LOC123501287 [Portunus trituberculatus]|uniref:uncharacterized protein LOC123501287 n=1 Tax=Portunus trituberculatus TaxID=210409 RepID=UPI001E1CB49F|nr:uncharacterized protein LOC123501287 [Portunus trituberculatus]
MNTQLVTVLALAAAAAAARPNYNFRYAVQDGRSGNDFGHQESRDLDSTVGSYHVYLPDGRLQQVSYRVHGGSGYLAEVTHKGEARFPDSGSYESFESREVHRPRYSTDSLESREGRVFVTPNFHFSRPRSGSFFTAPRLRAPARYGTSFFRLGAAGSDESYERRFDSSDSREHHFFSSDSDEDSFDFSDSREHRFGSSNSGEHRFYSSDSDELHFDSSDSREHRFDSSGSFKHRFGSRKSLELPFNHRKTGGNFLRLGSRTYYY